jgi:uncharacterized protein YbaR (Trm112 family)
MKYHVRRDVTSLSQVGGVVKQGEIIVHRTGNLLLTCPVCKRLQFAAVRLTGSDIAPDTDPIQCGSGGCKRCAQWFRIVTGEAVLLDGPPERKQPEIPERLQKAGVTPPPKLEAPEQ